MGDSARRLLVMILFAGSLIGPSIGHGMGSFCQGLFSAKSAHSSLLNLRTDYEALRAHREELAWLSGAVNEFHLFDGRGFSLPGVGLSVRPPAGNLFLPYPRILNKRTPFTEQRQLFSDGQLSPRDQKLLLNRKVAFRVNDYLGEDFSGENHGVLYGYVIGFGTKKFRNAERGPTEDTIHVLTIKDPGSREDINPVTVAVRISTIEDLILRRENPETAIENDVAKMLFKEHLLNTLGPEDAQRLLGPRPFDWYEGSLLGKNIIAKTDFSSELWLSGKVIYDSGSGQHREVRLEMYDPFTGLFEGSTHTFKNPSSVIYNEFND